jgi:hypothetical protein
LKLEILKFQIKDNASQLNRLGLQGLRRGSFSHRSSSARFD